MFCGLLVHPGMLVQKCTRQVLSATYDSYMQVMVVSHPDFFFMKSVNPNGV